MNNLKTLAKKAYNSSRFWFWAWIAASSVLPVVIIGQEYGLFSDSTSSMFKVGVASVVLAIFLIVRGWNIISEWAYELKEGTVREISIAAIKIMPYFFLMLIGHIVIIMTEEFFFVARVLFFTQAAGVYFRARNRTLKRKKLIEERGYVHVLKD